MSMDLGAVTTTTIMARMPTLMSTRLAEDAVEMWPSLAR